MPTYIQNIFISTCNQYKNYYILQFLFLFWGFESSMYYTLYTYKVHLNLTGHILSVQ